MVDALRSYWCLMGLTWGIIPSILGFPGLLHEVARLCTAFNNACRSCTQGCREKLSSSPISRSFWHFTGDPRLPIMCLHPAHKQPRLGLIPQEQGSLSCPGWRREVTKSSKPCGATATCPWQGLGEGLLCTKPPEGWQHARKVSVPGAKYSCWIMPCSAAGNGQRGPLLPLSL